ncbi:MAG: sulfatase-like hydrolase/transferase [bacterium]|nr:sulfatase-like hydrolase/transferase [bacterium]
MSLRLASTLVSLAMVLGLASCSDDRDARTPADWNVVLVTLDTVRADALGAYGQVRSTTPVLDRIAREGVVFTDVTSAAPHTVASHASIMTGLYPFAHGARANHGFPLAAEHTTLAEILAGAGHRTRAEIAAPVLHASTRIAQGFESEAHSAAATQGETPVARAPGGGLRRSAENVTARALETLDALHDEPFLLWLHYFDAHLPYVDRPADRAAFPDTPYLAQVHALDRSLGRVFAALEANGLRDHTLVVVTSDHGEGLGEHEEPTHSYFVYDSTMRVPLLLWGPDALPSGLRIDEPARTVDILPTILDLMGREVPAGLHGESLAPAIRGDGARAGAPIYGESLDLHRIFGTTPLRLIREGRWKYIHSAAPELYDVAADPSEREDLLAANPEVAARLADRLRELVERSAPTQGERPAALSAVDVARLEALGYVIPRARPRLEDEVALLAPRGPDPRGLAQAAETLSRAKGALSAGRYPRAIEALSPIVGAHPESATVLAMLGEAYAGQGDEAKALALFDRALAVEGDPCSETRLDRARTLERFGRPRARLAELEAALEGCADSATYLNELAWALATTPTEAGGDGARAVTLATRLVELGSGEPDPNQLDTLAAAWFAAGEPARAAAVQARALAILERSGAGPRLRAGYASALERYRRATPPGGDADAPVP